MEEVKKLYPFSFLPIGETFAWGGKELGKIYDKEFIECDDQGKEKTLLKDATIAESHEIADLGYRDSQVRDGWLAGNTISEIMDMYVDRVVGENVFQFFGRQFPVSVKFIDATGRMPLRVHPNDEIAGERYDFLGKAKLWYVVDAKPEAKLLLGFKEDASVQDFYTKCLDGSVESMLNTITPHKGECYVIEPGTVNAAAGGVTLLEVSEASPMDFCLSNWGAEAPENEFDGALTIVEAMDFIDYGAYKDQPVTAGEGAVTKLAKRQEFSANHIALKDPVHIFAERADSFTIYTCISGTATIQVPEGSGAANYQLGAGETLLVPAEVEDFFLVPRQSGTELIEVLVEKSEEADGYIDPNAEEKLPEDE